MDRARNGVAMHPASMKMLATRMKEQEFTKSDFVFVPAVRTPFDPQVHKAKERNQILTQCREYLLRFVDHFEPEVIIPLGAMAARQVSGRSVKITKVRGVIDENEDLGIPILPMLDPMFVLRYPQHDSTFEIDCKTLKAFVDADLSVENMSNRYGEYELVDDLQFLIDEQPAEISFDVETLGLRPHERSFKILSMQFCPEPGRAYIVLWDHPAHPISQRQRRKIRNQVRELLCRADCSIVGQNLKFDALALLVKLGIRIRQDHDTLVLQKLLDENMQDNTLDMLVRMHVPDLAGYNDDFNSKYDKSRMDLVPLNDLIDYGCGDTDASLRLYHILRPMVEEDELLWANYRHVAMAGLNAFCSMENRGQIIDETHLGEFEIQLAAKVEEDKQALFRRINREIKRKHARREEREALSFTRRDFLRDILFDHPKGCKLTPKVYTKGTEKLPDPKDWVPSTSSKDHLPYFFEHQRHGQFVMDLAQHLKDIRLLGTNVRRFRDQYITDGKIHPVYGLTASTGRTTSRDPNAQNFPARGPMAKTYKKIFIPPEGCFLLQADLSQAELRIAADMSHDPMMLEIYRNFGDIHTRTACIVMGVTTQQFMNMPAEERALARFKAKAVNFGFIYGMGWRKFIVYAKTQYGVEFTEQEARRIRHAFFQTYAGLTSWHLAMRNFVRRHGYVRSYSGRIRHLPTIHSSEEWIQQEAERQAINSPVQNFASDLGVMALGRMDVEIDCNYLAATQFVHDAIYCYTPYRYLDWAVRTLKWYMETNPIDEWFDRRMAAPITADVSFGLNGGETFELSGLNLHQPYDFNALFDREEVPEEKRPYIPAQEVPPNNGRAEVQEHLLIY